MLVSGGVQPPEVEMIFTEDAFQAAAAFNAQKEIAGCVSWAPDIYNLSKIKGNRMLVTTQEANRLIADVWFARADFARDHMADPRRDRPRHLRRHGTPQARIRAEEGLRTHGRGLQHSRRPMRFRCWATPTAPTGPRTSSSSSMRTIRRISSGSGSGPTCSIAASARSVIARCRSTRSWISRSSRSSAG